MHLFMILFLTYLLIVEPFFEQRAFKRFFNSWKENKSARLTLYKQAFHRNWLLGGAVVFLVWYGEIPWSSLGFRPIDPAHFYTLSWPWQAAAIGFAAWYFTWLYFCALVLSRINKRFKNVVIRIIQKSHWLTPRTPQEYAWWVANACTASIEELVYRGFVFYALLAFFPNCPLVALVGISILLDAMRYAPRLVAMKYVALTGIIFSLGYIVFNSIWIAMLLHVLHDLRTLAVPFHWVRESWEKNPEVAGNA